MLWPKKRTASTAGRIRIQNTCRESTPCLQHERPFPPRQRTPRPRSRPRPRPRPDQVKPDHLTSHKERPFPGRSKGYGYNGCGTPVSTSPQAHMSPQVLYHSITSAYLAGARPGPRPGKATGRAGIFCPPRDPFPSLRSSRLLVASRTWACRRPRFFNSF